MRPQAKLSVIAAMTVGAALLLTACSAGAAAPSPLTTVGSVAGVGGPSPSTATPGSPTPVAPPRSTASPAPSIGPLVGSIPSTVGGQPVLLIPAAVTRLVATTTDAPLLVGGWFHHPAPVWWCPSQGYVQPWGSCLRFALYEHSEGSLGATIGKPVWVYGMPPNESILVYPGEQAAFDQAEPYAATRPVVLSIHTHDPGCPTGLRILGETCATQAVLEAIVWLGPPVVAASSMP